MMVGSSIKAPEKLNKPAGQVVLNVDNICCVSKSQFGTSLTNVTFDLRQGEILGIGGVAGSGQMNYLRLCQVSNSRSMAALVLMN